MAEALHVLRDALARLGQTSDAPQQPTTLCREAQARELDAHLAVFLRGSSPRCVHATGFPGTGKSHTVASFLARHAATCRCFSFNAARGGVTLEAIAASCAAQARPRPRGETPLARFAAAFRTTPCVLAVEAFDALFADTRALYAFFDVLAAEQPRVLLVMLSRTIAFPALFHSRLESRLAFATVFFPPYSLADIADIVRGRLGEQAARALFPEPGGVARLVAESCGGFGSPSIHDAFAAVRRRVAAEHSRAAHKPRQEGQRTPTPRKTPRRSVSWVVQRAASRRSLLRDTQGTPRDPIEVK